MTFFFRFLLSKRKRKNCRSPFFRKRSSSWNRRSFRIPIPSSEQYNVAEEHEHEDPCLLLQLPTSILADIFSRLPFEAVCISASVSKVLRSLIRSPDFNSLRLERVDSEVFLRPDSVLCSSRTLHLMDLRRVSSAPAIAPGCELHPPAMDVKVRVFLPKSGGLDPNVVVRKRSVSFGAQLRYEIVNSCNGLICLRKASMYNGCKSPCIVCNPFTGEFMFIPKLQKTGTTKNWGAVSGFGCSARNNVYKVVRLVYGASASNPFDRIAEVYNIGSDSWRTIGPAPWDTVLEGSATFLNGAIHWLSEGSDSVCKSSILCFDFREEKFLSLKLPSHFLEKMVDDPRKSKLTLGVLRRRLCISGIDLINHFHIWVMRDYGDHESWTKEFSFHFFCGAMCRPIKWLENEDLVMLCDKIGLAIYNPVSKTFRKFKLLGTKAVIFQAFAHIPNFGSLKDITGADNLVVHYYQSRWNVPGEMEDAEVVSLVEEDHGVDWAFNLWF